MNKLIIKNTFKGTVGIRNDTIDNSINNNISLIVQLEDTNLRMLLNVEELKNHIRESDSFYDSLFGDKPYTLKYYYWNPSEFETELENKRKQILGDEWFHLLKDEFEKDYLINIGKKIAYWRQVIEIQPQKEDLFKAFNLCQPSKTRVVILGQEPYPHKAADGLAFSSKELFLPKALEKIYQAIEKDIYNGLYLNQENDLSFLAEQGVFLLNTVLTVVENQIKSHNDLGWQKFTSTAISRLSKNTDNVVFLLWGSQAKSFEKYIQNKENHYILTCEHPTAAFYDGNRNWEFENCFSRCNKYLKEFGYKEINW